MYLAVYLVCIWCVFLVCIVGVYSCVVFVDICMYVCIWFVFLVCIVGVYFLWGIYKYLCVCVYFVCIFGVYFVTIGFHKVICGKTGAGPPQCFYVCGFVFGSFLLDVLAVPPCLCTTCCWT